MSPKTIENSEERYVFNEKALDLVDDLETEIFNLMMKHAEILAQSKKPGPRGKSVIEPTDMKSILKEVLLEILKTYDRPAA